ncbi:MAG: molybdate ABC transporter substrate-binding protein [Gammaproteobacteria bacterium]|nr:MAG: molybdate ABC transporter substrate-binding protein [Gammaproteobacteria bacterium]
MPSKKLICFILLSLTIALTNNVNAKTIRIAVASNFVETARQLSRSFEETSEHSIQISSGSSGKLYLQIVNGAPFDLFLSADSDKPNELVKNGFAIADSQQIYAVGKLVLWLKHCSTQNNLKTLSNSRIKKIAIANPKLAPYGFASKKLLEHHQLWEIVSKKLIYPENIAQVAQYAKLGVIDAALIAESNVKHLGLGKESCLIELQTGDYPAINQQLVILTKSENKRLAKDFVRFLASKNAQILIKNMGYLLPNSARIAQ